jgi:16S rRNA (guanine(966)-N(2))-methyltransferase RsmD
MKGFHSRPTTDFGKEGLFNILEHSIELNQINVLDLFAGTGNVSFEFISRGALLVHSVDSNFKAFRFIKNTSSSLGIEKQCHYITKSDSKKFLEKIEGQYDIIFADPPFDYEDYKTIILSIKEHQRLKSNGLIIIEHAKNVNISHIDGYQKTHTFGHVRFSFFNFEHDE